jgi:thiol-disulfide isomerase/thioredoxin
MAGIDPAAAQESAGSAEREGAVSDTPSPRVADTVASAPRTPVERHGKLLLIAVVAVALVALVWPRGSGGPSAGGFLVDASGRPALLGKRMAPVTVVHFFASWCPPCLHETPALSRLAVDLEDEPRFRVIMVAVQDDVERAQRLAGSDQVLFDPAWEVAHRYGTRQLPESYLVVDGEVERKFVGAVDWDGAGVRDTVQRALAAARGKGT